MAAPIAGVVVGWLGGSAAIGAIGVALVEIGVSIAISQLARVVMGDRQKGDNPGIRTQVTLEGGTLPQTMILGRYATAGSYTAPPYARGRTGDIENAFRWPIYTLADMPVTSLRRFWVNGERFRNPEDLTGTLSHNTTRKANATTKERYTEDSDTFMVGFMDGTQTTASTTLTGQFGTHSERPWTSRMIGTGVAYAFFMLRYDPELYQGEIRPRFELDGSKLYDRRLDGTNGGTGTQREATASTWALSYNPMLMIENIARGIRLPDGRVWGLGAEWADMPQSFWNPAKNACDVARPDGEAKYRAGYEVRMATPDMGGDDPYDVIDELLKACNGVWADVGGTFVVRCGAPGLPIFTVTDNDVLVDRKQDATQFDGREGIYNAIRATFTNPNQQWQPSELPLRTNATWEAEDGERLVASVNFKAVWDRQQARQLAAEYIKSSRRMRKHSVTFPPKYSGTIPTNVFAWDSVKHGYVGKAFEVQEVAIDPDTLATTLSIGEVDPNDYNPEAFVDPGDPSDVPVVVVPGPIPGFGAQAVTITDSNGAARRPGIRMFWPAGLTLKSIVYEIRVKSTLADVTGGTITNIPKLSHNTSDGILPNETYEVRARRPGRRKPWTAWITVTTGNIKLGPGDVDTVNPGDGLPATAPTGFAGQGIIRGVWLSWNKNPEPDIVGYEIFERTTSTAPISSTTPTFYVGPNTTFFGRQNLPDSATRFYWIRARDSDGASAWVAMNPASVTTTANLGITATELEGLIDATAFATGLNPVRIINTGALPATRQGSDLLIYMGDVYRWTNGAYIKSVKAADIVDKLVAAQIEAGAVTAVQVAANAISTKHMGVFDYESKQPVFGFEDNDVTVFAGVNRTLTPTTSGTVSGSRAMTMTKTAAAGNFASIFTTTGYLFPVEPGDKLWIECSFKTGDGVARTAAFNFGYYFFDRLKAPLATNDVVMNDIDAANQDGPFNISTSNQRRTKKIEVPAGAAFATAYGRIESAMPSGSQVQIDRMVPRTANGAELIVDGTLKGIKLEIESLAATLALIGTAWITRVHIVDGEIVRAKIGDLAVNAAKIENLTINDGKVANLGITQSLKIKGHILYYTGLFKWFVDKTKSHHYDGGYRLTSSNGAVTLVGFTVPRVSGGQTVVRVATKIAGWGSDAPCLYILERKDGSGNWVRCSDAMVRSAYQGSTANSYILLFDTNQSGNPAGKTRTSYRLRAQKQNQPGHNYDVKIMGSSYEVQHYKQNG